MGDFSHQDTDQNIAVLPQAEHIRGDTSNNPDASTNNNPNASASGPPAQAAIIEANIEGNANFIVSILYPVMKVLNADELVLLFNRMKQKC